MIGLAAVFVILGPGSAVSQPPQQAPVIGRWDLTVQGPDGTFPSWLEVELSGNRTLVGRFVARSGSARPVSKVEFTNNTMRFAIPPQWEQGENDLRVEGTLDGDKLSGWMTDPAGVRLTWTAVRAPALRRSGEPTWGSPIRLFNGSDLTGWEPTGGTNQWRVVGGVLTSPKAGTNLVTKQTFTDFKLHAEFRYPRAGNSGLYLRGRHEVQIEDSKGMEPGSHHMGGVYGFLTPNEDAALNAGDWQTYDITLVGRLVTVVLNGKTVISQQEIPGITGGALNSDEGSPGPLMLQGDHAPVEFRSIVLTPAR
ncbi:MAG: DUF1080 domain-containing protein [Gemmatimonadaceae bacterium]